MKDTWSRRALLIASGMAITALHPALAQQEFPNRTVRIVVPYPPGGSADALTRIIANELQSEFSQSVIVDNKPGASGAIGTRFVAKGESDGHVILLGTDQTHVKNVFLLKDPQYDAIKDFAPIMGMTDLPLVLVVRNDLPVKDIGELVALAKKEPGKLNYGSSGVGSGSHLAMELMAQRAGIAMTHIPYSGAAPMAAEIVAGRLDTAFVTLPSVMGQIKNGAMRPLAVASGKRAGNLPEVPTLAEAGIKDAESDAWLALFAPAATPEAARRKLTEAVARTLGKPAVIEQINKLGYVLNARDPKSFSEYLAAETKKWGEVVKTARIEQQ